MLSDRQLLFLLGSGAAGAGTWYGGRALYRRSQRKSMERYDRRKRMSIAAANQKLMQEIMKQQMK